MKALDRITHKEKSTLYRKEGRKYVQVNDLYAYEGLREGWWLVQVREGCTSIRAAVYPDRAEIEAAIKEKVDKVEEIIFEATQARLKNRAISPELQKDWDALIEKHGKEMSAFEYDSIADISKKIITKLTETKMMKKCEKCGRDLPKDSRVYSCTVGSGCADYYPPNVDTIHPESKPDTAEQFGDEGLDKTTCLQCIEWKTLADDALNTLRITREKYGIGNRHVMREKNREIEKMLAALKNATELLGEIMRDEVNHQDEAGKWLRAYGHYAANAIGEPAAGSPTH